MANYLLAMARWHSDTRIDRWMDDIGMIHIGQLWGSGFVLRFLGIPDLQLLQGEGLLFIPHAKSLLADAIIQYFAQIKN